MMTYPPGLHHLRLISQVVIGEATEHDLEELSGPARGADAAL
jgi:hypothetical protein